MIGSLQPGSTKAEQDVIKGFYIMKGPEGEEETIWLTETCKNHTNEHILKSERSRFKTKN